MTAEQWVDAFLRLTGHLLAWPVVALVIAIVFRRRIISALTALSERARSASVGPLSVEFDGTAVEALQDTVRQAIRRRPGADPEQLADFLDEQISKMTEQSIKRTEESFPGRRVLWVNDNAEHNLFEINYLRRLGTELEMAPSTEAALRALDSDGFNVVVSDMHRVEDGAERPRAGLTLLERMRTAHRRTPVVFYTSNAELLRDDPRISADGAAVTDSAADLFAQVKHVLRQRPGERE